MIQDDRTRTIRAILFEDWDPVGFGSLLPAGEYDHYVPGIAQLLESHCTAEQLEAHLIELEKKYFGERQAGEKAQRAAQKLVASWSMGG
jgi:hypothetical protein